MPVGRQIFLSLEIFRVVWVHAVDDMQAADDKIQFRVCLHEGI
jgi:hypothetical protein